MTLYAGSSCFPRTNNPNSQNVAKIDRFLNTKNIVETLYLFAHHRKFGKITNIYSTTTKNVLEKNNFQRTVKKSLFAG